MPGNTPQLPLQGAGPVLPGCGTAHECAQLMSVPGLHDDENPLWTQWYTLCTYMTQPTPGICPMIFYFLAFQSLVAYVCFIKMLTNVSYSVTICCNIGLSKAF